MPDVRQDAGTDRWRGPTRDETGARGCTGCCRCSARTGAAAVRPCG